MVIDSTLVEEALASVQAEAAYAHIKRNQANDELLHWQNEAERLHPFVDCDHEWELDGGFITCQRCGWSHMENTNV